MITLFRKTRLRLLEESSLRKYLLYAIGEILLVVIGILIAVQINNWNEEKKDRQIEFKTMKSLKDDLLVQKEILNKQVTHEETQVSLCDSVSLFFIGGITIEKLEQLLNTLVTRRTLIANQPTYDNLKASKGISIFSNQQLQNDIMRYYQNLEYVIRVTDNNNSLMIDNIYGVFISNNLLGLTMDSQGKIGIVNFTNEKRYLLKSELLERKAASESITIICKEQNKLTKELLLNLSKSIEKFE